MTEWFEEDEPVYTHARSPYTRVDILASSKLVRVEVDGPRLVAKLLLAFEVVLAVDVAPPAADGPEGLIVKATHPPRFFERFGRLAVEHELDVRRLEPLDESAHAILGYLLGGSGKT